MKNKEYDCIQMKQEGAKRILEEIKGMSIEEEVAYWKEKTDLLRKKKNERKDRRE